MNDLASREKSFETIHLGEVSEITMGQSPESANVNTNEEGVPFLQGCAEFGRQSPATTVYCNPPLRISKPASVLVSVRAPVGALNWGGQKFCIGRGLAAIKAVPRIADTRYLFYVLAENVSFLHRRSQGSTFLAVGSDDLKLFPVPAFRLEKQEKIARILQTIDKAIEKTEALIDKYQQIKAGLMHDLFTRGIGDDDQLRPPREQAPELYRETPIGWIPKEWDFAPAGAYTESWAMGPRFSADEYTENGNVATLRTTDISDDGTINYDTMPIARLQLSGLTSHLLKEDDFVITRSGTCGICAVFEESAIPVLPGAFLIRFRFNSGLTPHFATIYLNSDIGNRLVYRIAEGGVQKNLRGSSLAKVEIPIPQRDEQERILRLVAGVTARIESDRNYREKLMKQRSGLMCDLLTGKVPVQVKSDVKPEAAYV